MQKVGLGGSCYWCTEAIFRSLAGVVSVSQGWLKSREHDSFAEGVIVEYDEAIINLYAIIQIHLHTHSSTSAHGLREKYRSAIYVYSLAQQQKAKGCLFKLQQEFSQPLVTQVLEYQSYEPSEAEYHDYYYADPAKPFCTNLITPKLQELLNRFGDRVSDDARKVIEYQGSKRYEGDGYSGG
ncbi:peptide-methionine (S)-S-oxide reductase [uncultured Photobacterium sp.]|uniref:peptide-methionine (S)-S-oxide reductase n=1 Tax=uncultured Photobacterium sp. TaxID=173973 RepID=UPI00260EFFF5|nr:peptide-methionine (S)-S-oxide reductase [uncultured Photobacterium sp.]